jgi:multiple sugar transport system substrate-binding protein
MVKGCTSFRRVYLTVCCRILLGVILLFSLAACQSPTGLASEIILTPTQQKAEELSPTPISQAPRTPVRATSTPTSVPGDPAQDLRGQLVKFWYVSDARAGDLVQKWVDEFNTTNRWGIRVEAVPHESSGMLDEKIRSAVEQKKTPDLLAHYSHDLRYWNEVSNLLVDLQPYVDDAAWGLALGDQRDFFPNIWAQDIVTSTAGGESPIRLGLPWYRSGLVMLYNQGWAEELGFNKPPDNPAQFRLQACKAAQANREDTIKSNDGTGGWFYTFEPTVLLSWIFALGGQVQNAEGDGYQFDTPEALDALTFIHQLNAQGCAWHSSDIDPQEAFASREALFLTLPLNDLLDQQRLFQEQDNSDEWTVLAFPSRLGGALDVYGPSLAVLKSNPERQLAAWLFLRWLTSAEKQAEWILESGTLPTRASVLPLLKGERGGLPQWETALGLLPFAQVEPAQASWRTLRWALRDMQMQLLAVGFKGEQIPALLESMDQLSAEVASQEQTLK